MIETLNKNILGFNPCSQEISSFTKDITPEMAKYILNFHNKDNRKIDKSQVRKIANSILIDGWLEDGQPLTFNVEGNITEAQHRLLSIIETGMTVRMIVVIGVDTGCFTKCAAAKPRKAEDEIQRKDKTATQSEVSTLRQLLLRRQGDKLTIQNAIDMWVKWRLVVREGRKLVDGFFDSVEDYNPWERTFAAWASLMISIGEEETATTLLSLLQAEILEDESACCLTREFRKFFAENTTYMSNAGRTNFIFQLLCAASDRLIKQPNGEVQLGLSIDQYNHDYLKKKGVYRKFLENPDSLQISVLPF
jgi:hypothetical protein